MLGAVYAPAMALQRLCLGFTGFGRSPATLRAMPAQAAAMAQRLGMGGL